MSSSTILNTVYFKTNEAKHLNEISIIIWDKTKTKHSSTFHVALNKALSKPRSNAVSAIVRTKDVRNGQMQEPYQSGTRLWLYFNLSNWLRNDVFIRINRNRVIGSCRNYLSRWKYRTVASSMVADIRRSDKINYTFK